MTKKIEEYFTINNNLREERDNAVAQIKSIQQQSTELRAFLEALVAKLKLTFPETIGAPGLFEQVDKFYKALYPAHASAPNTPTQSRRPSVGAPLARKNVGFDISFSPDPAKTNEGRGVKTSAVDLADRDEPPKKAKKDE